MITILKGDKGNIDLLNQIELTDIELYEFIKFLRTLFYSVREEEVNSFRFERLGSKSFTKEWEPEEYQLLLDWNRDNEEVSKFLGRSWMGIEMKRIYYIPEMMEFAKKRNLNLFKATKAEINGLVNEYIKEHEDELKKRKEERVEERREIKEVRKLVENYPQREKEINFMIGLGKLKEKDLENLRKEKEEAEKKLKELENEKN